MTVPHIPLPPPGVVLIAAERRRQIEVEGYSIEHDVATHPDQQLAVAAWCYLTNVVARCYLDVVGDDIDIVAPCYLTDDDIDIASSEVGEPAGWPWPAGSWKPTPDDPVSQLAKAGALIAAEIDRRQAS